jgi:ATP synthase subunit 6
MFLKITSPLEQFEIHPLIKLGIGWLDFSITNSTLTLGVILTLLTTFYLLTLKTPQLVPTRWQTLAEMLYELVSTFIKDQIGDKGAPYFPFIFTLFTFILLCNGFGMIPYSFTVTTHFVITFFLSLTVFFGVTLMGFQYHGISFLRIFLPSGTSILLAPLLILIEIISYFAKAISLAVRLAANMMAGHTLLHILSGFAWNMLLTGGLLSLAALVPTAIVFVLIPLELAIAFLQAYVFTVLTCSYIKDSISLH